MSVAHKEPLTKPPQGFRYYGKPREVLRDDTLLPYQHLVLRAWKEMKLTAVLTLSGIPTVYLCDRKRPLAPADAAEIHRQFWNQGVATVLLLRDPEKVRVFSSMTKPVKASTATQDEIDDRLVEEINLATLVSWLERFYLRLGTGQYYGDNEAKFDPQQGVDAYLIDNLGAVRNELTQGDDGLKPPVAHAFLGRLLFTCYLCDRGIIELRDYFPKRSWKCLHDLLAEHEDDDPRPDLYDKLFPALKREFNGSMFDDDIEAERELISPAHLKAIRRFLNGDEVRKGKGQRSLGFWAYDFKFIPVETISAIYEDFLEKEGAPEKRKSGAYHTPRFLAEMTLDLALEGERPLRSRQYLDPAVGSGIFLVLLFNRLAAEWRATHRGKTPLEEQAKDLRALLGSLRGVDKNLTACRIACFSLYLAFLNQFDPPAVRAYMKATGEKLPSLLKYANRKKKAPVIPVIWEKDFFQLATDWKGQFHIVVGNPPWAGRGSKQIAHKFMAAAPDVLKDDSGRACLLLPSKVFLNQTDKFQSQWLRRVTLDKVVQLADYSFVLFKEALCPCNIVRFTKQPPDVAKHEIEYVTPKVSRMDLRDGIIPVAPQDRKWIPLRLLLNAAKRVTAPVAWKSHFWGTQRDLKFLDYLLTLPSLGQLVGTAREVERGQKRWSKGQGFQPLRPRQKTKEPKVLNWSMTDPFVTPESINDVLSLPRQHTHKLGDHLKERGYLIEKARRKPAERIFQAPLVLFNQGFTAGAFFDYGVRFQDSLQSISGEPEDTEGLLFLTAFLRSMLARYFVFHTAANLGTERDKVHLFEVLRLPFFLPDSEAARPNEATIVSKVADKIQRLKRNMEADATKLEEELQSAEFHLQSEDEGTDEQKRKRWLVRQRHRSRKLQAELEPLIYEYFGLNEQEIALVEDTCEIFDKSDTPGSLDGAKSIPTLQPVDADGLEPYAGMLTATLNEWASDSLRVSASGCVDSKVGLGLVRLDQTKSARRFRTRAVSGELVTALHRLEEASTERSGILAYLRRPWVFDGTRIYIVKPALKGQWTCSAALNDAADLYAHIAEARRRAK